MKAAFTLSVLLLQKPSHRSKPKDHTACLASHGRRLIWGILLLRVGIFYQGYLDMASGRANVKAVL